MYKRMCGILTNMFYRACRLRYIIIHWNDIIRTIKWQLELQCSIFLRLNRYLFLLWLTGRTEETTNLRLGKLSYFGQEYLKQTTVKWTLRFFLNDKICPFTLFWNEWWIYNHNFRFNKFHKIFKSENPI